MARESPGCGHLTRSGPLHCGTVSSIHATDRGHSGRGGHCGSGSDNSDMLAMFGDILHYSERVPSIKNPLSLLCSCKHYQHTDMQSRQVAMSTMSTHGGLYSYYSWLVPDCGPPDSSALEPFHHHGGQTISRHSAETRTHSSRLGWNEY